MIAWAWWPLRPAHEEAGRGGTAREVDTRPAALRPQHSPRQAHTPGFTKAPAIPLRSLPGARRGLGGTQRKLKGKKVRFGQLARADTAPTPSGLRRKMAGFAIQPAAGPVAGAGAGSVNVGLDRRLRPGGGGGVPCAHTTRPSHSTQLSARAVFMLTWFCASLPSLLKKEILILPDAYLSSSETEGQAL